MPSDFAPVRGILARERQEGRPLPEAWKVALEASRTDVIWTSSSRCWSQPPCVGARGAKRSGSRSPPGNLA